uniref:Uncharacterized protein n=1 Tax=Rhizophora mucronata TaxID=61149 RepID=A0A2P2NUE3_RHIMU
MGCYGGHSFWGREGSSWHQQANHTA